MSDRARFEKLALPHRDAAFNLAYWIVRDRDDAEDVVQDAYLRAFKAFAGFKGEAMRPWLLAIVRNAALRTLSQRRRATNVMASGQALAAASAAEVDEIASLEPSPEDILVSAVEARQLRAALASLPIAYRDILVLREFEDMPYAEIAQITGVPIGTVMSRLARGRAMLRSMIERMRAEDKTDDV